MEKHEPRPPTRPPLTPVRSGSARHGPAGRLAGGPAARPRRPAGSPTRSSMVTPACGTASSWLRELPRLRRRPCRCTCRRRWSGSGSASTSPAGAEPGRSWSGPCRGSGWRWCSTAGWTGRWSAYAAAPTTRWCTSPSGASRRPGAGPAPTARRCGPDRGAGAADRRRRWRRSSRPRRPGPASRCATVDGDELGRFTLSPVPRTADRLQAGNGELVLVADLDLRLN